MFKEVMQILGLVLVMGGVFALTWLTTRFMSKRLPGNAKISRMQILEKMPLGKDRQVALVKIGNEHFMIGISGQQISFSQAFRLEQPEEAPIDSEVIHAQQDH